MGHTKLTIRLQDFTSGISSALSWRDVTTDCMSAQPSQGHTGPRQFMPQVGQCSYFFKNPSSTYTPVGNREDSSATYLEIGRRIQQIVTLPSHGKALRVSYNNATTLNTAYLSQTVSTTLTAKDMITLEFDARCESDFLRNAIRVEIRTNAPETCEGQVFEITRKWRTYRLTFIPQSSATSITPRFYSAFTADGTNIEFRTMSLKLDSNPFSNLFTNSDFASGSTGWSVTSATATGIDDYKVLFDGIIQSIQPAPFSLGDRVTAVLALDWVSVLTDPTAKFALQKNKRADELITTALSNIPATYWVQAPPGRLLAQGHQTFERSFTGYTEKETNLFQAIGDAVESENGIFWCDQDGTYRFENNTFHSRRQLLEGIPRPAYHVFTANPANGNTLTLWLDAYTFKTVIANPFDVLIGSSTVATARNLVNAINMDAASMGTAYPATTPIHNTAEARLLDYRTVVLDDTPTVYLRLGESSGTSAVDSSGNAHTATYVNGVTLGTAGAIPTDSDTGVTLDGTNDNISIPTIPLYMCSFSVELWLKAGAAPAATQDIFSAYSAFVTDQAFYIRINSTGSITVDFYNDSYTTSTGVITFGGSTYQHLVVTYNQTTDTLYIYVNGLQVGTASIGFFNSTTSPTLTLGGFPAAGSNYYKGSLDEFALYLSALSADRVAAHYAARYVAVALTKYRNGSETPELTLAEGTLNPYEMNPVRTADTVINKSLITWTPRTTTTGNVTLGQIQGAVQIPPKSTVSSDVKIGFPNVADGRVGTQELTITYRDDAGRFISGDAVIDPVATTDYRIYERSDAGGYEYTTQSNYFWISNIQKNATQFTCTLNNNAIGALYATTFQVRGKAVYSYDEQEEKSTNQTSINLYRERSLERRMPFTNDQQFCKSLAGYITERYGYPFVEAQSIEVSNRDTLNSQYLLGLGLMDTIVITDSRSGLSGVRHMIVGISMALTPTSTNDYLESIKFTLERLDQNQYFILSNSTYGLLGASGNSRLYI